MKLKQILGWAFLVFLAYYLLTQPAAAGHTAHSLLGDLKSAGNSVATFFNSVSS